MHSTSVVCNNWGKINLPRKKTLNIACFFYIVILCLNAYCTETTRLLKDINDKVSVENYWDIGELFEFDGQCFFTADQEPYGQELWKSNGTPQHTEMLLDIKNGGYSSYPNVFNNGIPIDGKFIFSAHDDSISPLYVGVWASDGTREGTHRLKTSLGGDGPCSGSFMTVFQDIMYMKASDSACGQELWRTDGTDDGTYLVKDINAGSLSSGLVFLTQFGGRMLFLARNATYGEELWSSDGTQQGTQLVKDINPGSRDAYFQYLTCFNNLIYFFAHSSEGKYALWVSDGTTQGTRIVKEMRYWAERGYIQKVNNAVCFYCVDIESGRELWRSDGTNAGTYVIKDLSSGDDYESIDQIQLWGNHIYFLARNELANRAFSDCLFRTDGTSKGTVILKQFGPYYPISEDIDSPGPTKLIEHLGQLYVQGEINFSTDLGMTNMKVFCSVSPDGQLITANPFPYELAENSNCVAYKDAYYFLADDGVHGQELWKFDGTSQYGVMANDCNPDGDGVFELLPVGDVLYLVANDGLHERELWRLDGAADRMQMIKDINFIAESSTPNFHGVINSSAIFTANDSEHGRELWKSDGSLQGTCLLKDIVPGPKGTLISPPFRPWPEGDIYFLIKDDFESAQCTQLWKTNGTTEGTLKVDDLTEVDSFVNVNGYAVTGNDALFGLTEWGSGLWKTDGSPEGTMKLKDIGASAPFISLNGVVYFNGYDNENGQGLWRSDGTVSGTQIVKIINPPGLGSYHIVQAFVANKTIYLNIWEPTHGNELWRTDGSEQGTYLLKDIWEGTGSSDPGDGFELNGRAFFSANDNIHGKELWTIDPQTEEVNLFKDINEGSNSSCPKFITRFGEHIYFIAIGSTSEWELWKTDGTQEGTFAVCTIQPESFTTPSAFVIANHKIWFAGYTTQTGHELWCSDGTKEGTYMVKDIYEGINGSSPCNIIEAWRKIYFVATDGLNESHVWCSDGTADGTQSIENKGQFTYKSPYCLNPLNDSIVFNAANFETGAELWVLEHDNSTRLWGDYQ